MNLIKNDKVAGFDVDDTLIIWTTEPSENTIHEISGDGYYHEPYYPHIEEIKKLRHTGWDIVVWSAGGYDWANKVVKILGLDPYITTVMCKPIRLYDDLPLKEILPETRYRSEN